MAAKKINQPNVRDDAEHREDSKTLAYEVRSLISVVRNFLPNLITKDPVTNNAYVESFAIHVRALIDFLYSHVFVDKDGEPRVRRDTDIFAIDYDPDWGKCVTTCPSWAVEAKKQADKTIAHLTTERRGVNQPGSGVNRVWRIREIAIEICRELQSFFDRLPPKLAVVRFDADSLSEMRLRINDFLSLHAVSDAKLTPVAPPSMTAATTSQSPSSPTSGSTPLFNMHGRTE